MNTFYYIANARMPTEKAHGVQIAHMCEAFADQGEQIELLVPYRKSQITTDVYDYYDVKKNFVVKKLPAFDFVAYGKVGAFVSTLSFLISARVYLWTKKADIIYSREPFATLFFNRVVLELHALPEQIKYLNVLMWRRSRALVVKTKYISEQITHKGIDSAKITVHSNGVDLKQFEVSESKAELRKKLSLPVDKKIALYSGTFFVHAWKGVKVFLESIRFFAPDEVAVLVGGNDKELKEIIENEHIIPIGKQPHNLVPQYLAAADVLVLPNTKGDAVSEFYTSPLKLFEYMASRIPIVASDLPAVREIAGDDSVLLVEPNNPEALYNAIHKAFSEKELTLHLAHQAYMIAERNSWASHAQEILQFIHNHEKNY